MQINLATAISALQSSDGIGSAQEAIQVLEGLRVQNNKPYMTHFLKTWPQFFNDVRFGRKTFEVRKQDRDFQVGDLLVLQEWDNKKKEYTKETESCEVVYLLEGGQFGIEEGFCVLGIKVIEHP